MKSRARIGRRAALAGAGALTLIGAGLAIALPGLIGPGNRIQPSGRKLDPAGRLTQLGNAPAGGALTRDGRFLWTLSAGRGPNDIRIVAVEPRARRRGRLVQKILMPGVSGGIAMDPSTNTVYVSGVPESPHADQQVPESVPGREGDAIHVFRYNARTGRARRAGVIPVPPPSGAPAYQTFPPNVSSKLSWPRDLVVSPDGSTLLAALNLADAAAIVDTKTHQVRYVNVGHYPYGVAITRDSQTGLVTSETSGRVAVIDLADASVERQIQVGPNLSHPEGMAIDPRAPRAYVAIANEDQIAVIDTDSMRLQRTLSVARPEGTGATPTQVSVTADGCYLISSDSGEDALAVFALPRASRGTCHRHGQARPRAFQLVGRIPTSAYPVASAATPDGSRLAWVASKGVGVGPNRNGPDPDSPNDSDDNINRFGYLPSLVTGQAGVMRFPTLAQLRRLTPRADRELVPVNAAKPPAGTPIVANGPIQHVFYIVKENRTYDQVLGDDPRGDGEPGLTLFGKNVTPNLHALADRFPLLDHVYANSEASIDGHYWTAGGAVSDYVIKSWPQNYAGRGRPYDFGSYEVSAPPKGYIFQRLLDENIPFFNYGEALAGLSPLPDKDRTVGEEVSHAEVLANSDIGIPTPFCYDSDLSNSSVVLTSGLIQVYDSSLPPGAPATARSRFDCFRTRFALQMLTGSVPAFSYMILPNNHTEGTTPGRRTPTAQIASNDWALGQVVDLISHSSIWDSSLILVVEDDSQDGADHVDAHRIPALAIGPYARRGAVIHNRYDQLSFLTTAEIVIGLKPRYLGETLAVPLYRAFNSRPSNTEPYSAIVPPVDMTATNTAASPAAELSASLPLTGLDQVPQETLDEILWKSVHGERSNPPPPGPNASTADVESEEGQVTRVASGDSDG